MKSIYRCLECFQYTLNKKKCPKCGSVVKNPYPPKFSVLREIKYRNLIRKSDKTR